MSERIIRIKRYSPEQGGSPEPGNSSEPGSREELFPLPGDEKMTVLQALQQIYEEQDPTLAFEYSCRYGRCGLCAVEVNGKPRLACTTFLQEGETTIGPLSNLPVLRDLVIDRRPLENLIAAEQIFFTAKEESLIVHGESGKGPSKFAVSPGPAPATGSEPAPGKLFGQLQAPESLQKLLPCLECFCCHAACPGIAEHGSAGSDLNRFAGPYIFLKLAQMALHPRDTKDRRQQALSLGLDYCRNCRSCYCPQGIPIYREAIKTLISTFPNPE